MLRVWWKQLHLYHKEDPWRLSSSSKQFWDVLYLKENPLRLYDVCMIIDPGLQLHVWPKPCSMLSQGIHSWIKHSRDPELRTVFGSWQWLPISCTGVQTAADWMDQSSENYWTIIIEFVDHHPLSPNKDMITTVFADSFESRTSTVYVYTWLIYVLSCFLSCLYFITCKIHYFVFCIWTLFRLILLPCVVKVIAIWSFGSLFLLIRYYT